MSARPIQIYSGADSVRAMEAYRLAVEARRDDWPYVHVYPPPNAKDVHVVGSLVTPTQSTTKVEVLRYQVSSGKRFYLQAVVLGANVAIVPGQALFTIDRASSPSGNKQFMPEHGLVNIGFQLGSMSASQPWKLHRAREFEPVDIVRVNAANIALSEGDPNYFVCGLFGYEVPVLDTKYTR